MDGFGSYTNKLSLGLILNSAICEQVGWIIKFLNHMALTWETKLGVPCMKKVLGFYILVTDTEVECLMKVCFGIIPFLISKCNVSWHHIL